MTTAQTQEFAYIAVTKEGFVDGACFTESDDSAAWVREMEQAGMSIKRVPRIEAKRLLFTYLPDANGHAVHPSRRVTARGPVIGRYRDSEIPAWIETADGRRYEYAGTCGPAVDFTTLTDGQLALAPGIIYQPAAA